MLALCRGAWWCWRFLASRLNMLQPLLSCCCCRLLVAASPPPGGQGERAQGAGAVRAAGAADRAHQELCSRPGGARPGEGGKGTPRPKGPRQRVDSRCPVARTCCDWLTCLLPVAAVAGASPGGLWGTHQHLRQIWGAIRRAGPAAQVGDVMGRRYDGG